MLLKKFTFNVFLFVFPIIFMGIGFEYLLRKVPNNYSYKKNYLDRYSNQIEVLFLGNSHIFNGINPELLKYNSFNAANVSQSLNLDLALLEKYDEKWNKLKLIVVPVDYFSIYSSLEYGAEKWRIKNYNIYYKLGITSDFKDYVECIHGKTSSNVERLTNYFLYKKTNRTCNKLGFGLGNLSKFNKDLIKTGNESVRKHTVINVDSNIIFKNIRCLSSLQSFSKKHGVKILFVTCPAYKTYTSKLNAFQLNHTVSIITNIVRNNHDMLYLNLLNDTIMYNKKDFFDADHLNEFGAEKFTKQLDEVIRSVLKK